MHELIYLAQTTKRFTIDTQFDKCTGRPSSIQIEFNNEVLSIVALVEACHLPTDRDSLSFWLIRSLFRFVLQPTKVIYSWGSVAQALTPFVRYGYFTIEMLKQQQNIDVQRDFGSWYRDFAPNRCGYQPRWLLTTALAASTDENLDESERSNIWSFGLFPCNAAHWDLQKIGRMIHYATNRCLAITKLARFIRAGKVVASWGWPVISLLETPVSYFAVIFKINQSTQSKHNLLTPAFKYTPRLFSCSSFHSSPGQ